jgi:hypothetical protein
LADGIVSAAETGYAGSASQNQEMICLLNSQERDRLERIDSGLARIRVHVFTGKVLTFKRLHQPW